MRLGLYRLLTTLALPLIAYSGWKRCKKHQSQRQILPDLPKIPHCFASRFGRNPTQFKKQGIWIHAVSVGETRSIFPLLINLKKKYPTTPITLTNSSTQGAIQALQFSPVDIQHQMIPYDFPFAIHRFLDQIEPKLVIMIETEIWPNCYQACSKRDIPIILANARLKEQSFTTYQKWGGKMMTDALNQTAFIGAQSQTDAAYFLALGVHKDKVKTLGNLKFDMQIDAELDALVAQWKTDNQLNNRFTWVAASTHADPHGKTGKLGKANNPSNESEESLLLQAHKTLLKTQPDALLILTPRHAKRFDEVAGLLKSSGLNWIKRSENKTITSQTQVYLANSMGEMMLWFGSCNVAFIGGSLVPFGGHNILEPAALKKPVLSGPHYANLKALYEPFIEQGAVTLVADSHSLAKTLAELADSNQYQEELGLKAFQCYQKQSGALDKLMHEIKPFLN